MHKTACIRFQDRKRMLIKNPKSNRSKNDWMLSKRTSYAPLSCSNADASLSSPPIKCRVDVLSAYFNLTSNSIRELNMEKLRIHLGNISLYNIMT